MSVCLMCLQPLVHRSAFIARPSAKVDDSPLLYHPNCAKAMFGHAGAKAGNVQIEIAPGRAAAAPGWHFDVRRIQRFAREPNGQPLLPGTQCKLPVCVTADKRGVRLVVGPGNHILKPQNPGADLPENELVTMRVAETAGVDVTPCALVPLPDGSLALLIRRFDRPPDGDDTRIEDFCTLAGKPPEAKYDGTAELCAQIVRDHATEPLIEMARLFRRFVVAWWTGNGDMHLKDFAFITGSDGVRRLASAYGLQCTRLSSPDDRMALPVGGKRRDFTREDWLAFGERCELRRPAVERVLCGITESLDKAIDIVGRSPLPENARARFADILRMTCPVTAVS